MRSMHRRPEDKDQILNREGAKNAKKKIDWVDDNWISEGSKKEFLGALCVLSEAPQTKRDKLGG